MGGRGSSSGNVSKLPELKGSEKQIKWAEDLRKNVIKVINEESKIFAKNKNLLLDKSSYSFELNKEYYESYKKNIKEALKVNKSSAWIEGFKNFNEYHTKSAIESLHKEKGEESGIYRNRLNKRLATSSIAYERFINKNK